jgi:tRNA wybutosine-synthesizing protein 3
MKQHDFVDKDFEVAKARVLAELQACIDRSKKGDIDAPIRELIRFINDSTRYVTTSSCSGRVAVFCEVPDAKKKTGMTNVLPLGLLFSPWFRLLVVSLA